MDLKSTSEYPPRLSASQQESLLTALQDWSASHGLLVRPQPSFIDPNLDPGHSVTIPAPVTLFPSLFPKSCFVAANKIQTCYNELYARIASDESFLSNVMQELNGLDDFLVKLWDVHLRVKKEGYVQHAALGLFRSDYMIHDPEGGSPTIRQVEFNTISSSFGGLSTLVAKLHRYLAESDLYPKDSLLNLKASTDVEFPANETTDELAMGLKAAHTLYESERLERRLPLCILFVTQDGERNIFDQRHLEYSVTESGPKVFRVPFSHTLERISIAKDDAQRRLIYTPPHNAAEQYEVSVVYFRSTYTPDDFPNSRSWEARYLLERSAAIKCPSILTQLAGSKKVQQILAVPDSDVLSRYIRDEKVIANIRDTFAPIYPLDDTEAGQHAQKLAMSDVDCKKYVLKPQREGGGNNVYRTAIPSFLTKLGSPSKWRSYILMELIEPPPLRNTIIRHGKPLEGGTIAELGVYGTCLWKQKPGETPTILHNDEAGWLLRTKGADSEEGGVAAGFGAIDSVLLY